MRVLYSTFLQGISILEIQTMSVQNFIVGASGDFFSTFKKLSQQKTWSLEQEQHTVP